MYQQPRISPQPQMQPYIHSYNQQVMPDYAYGMPQPPINYAYPHMQPTRDDLQYDPAVNLANPLHTHDYPPMESHYRYGELPHQGDAGQYHLTQQFAQHHQRINPDDVFRPEDKYADPIIQQTIPRHSIQRACNEGGMDPFGIMTKFEETQYDDEPEYVVDDYQRNTLTDRRPDSATFAHEEPRRSLSSKGYLNLLHNGGRGEHNNPAHPEIFLEHTDVERSQTDPDMEKFVDQSRARMRYVRWSADADNSITGGGISESQAIERRKQVDINLRPRMKIFTTSKDGRREGLRREYKHKSITNKVINSRAYGDRIADWALNPQRKTTKMSNREYENSAFFRQSTSDHEFQIARYGDTANRSRRLDQNSGSRVDAVATDNVFVEGKLARTYKATALLMADLVRIKHEARMDGEKGQHTDAQARKFKGRSEDLRKVVDQMHFETRFAKQSQATNPKNKCPEMLPLQQLITAQSHVQPAHMLHNAEIMYKTTHKKVDLNEAQRNVITSHTAPHIQDLNTCVNKQQHLNPKHDAKNSRIEVDGKSLEINNYKAPLLRSDANKVEQFNAEDFASTEDDTQTRAVLHTQYRTAKPSDHSQDTDVADNKGRPRVTGAVGSKYTQRLISRDSTMSEGMLGDK